MKLTHIRIQCLWSIFRGPPEAFAPAAVRLISHTLAQPISGSEGSTAKFPAALLTFLNRCPGIGIEKQILQSPLTFTSGICLERSDTTPGGLVPIAPSLHRRYVPTGDIGLWAGFSDEPRCPEWARRPPTHNLVAAIPTNNRPLLDQ